MSTGQQGQIGLVHDRVQVARRNVQPATIADANVGDSRAARTFLHRPVLVREGRDAQRLGGLEESRRDRTGIGGGLHEDLAAATASFRIGGAMPVLDSPIDVEDMPIVPGIVASLFGPEIEIVLVTAGPDHSVDAGATAEGLAHGLNDRAIVDAWAAFRAEVPIELAALVEKPGLGNQDAGLQIAWQPLAQQNLRIG